ncbi:MAG TPA: glycosyltransferase family 1 protein [Blastocatellia bacterium]|nr:glycosyltransferase family 1 protein [Blastocatellia bacterium]
MRIALDGIPLVAAKTGVGHYTDALAEWLARTHPDHQYDLFSPFDFAFDHHNGHRPGNLNKRFIPVRRPFSKWWLIGLPTLLRITPVDVFHGTNYCIPLFAPCPTVVTIHDLSLYTQAKTHEADNVARGRRRIPIMARRATRIIAPSEATRREIISHLGVGEERIRVIPEAARQHLRHCAADECRPVLERHGIRQPYLLYVGTIEPRKNLTTLVRAYDELIHTTPHRPQLVLCGGRGWLCDDIYRLVDELRLGEMVRFTGYVDDSDLPALYSAAEVFIYPSLYEGFGLPPLEAMACGTPVVTSNTSSLPEVVGEAGLGLPPQDVEAMTEAMAKLMADPTMRGYYSRAGLERAKLFSWERAADETQAVYDEVFEQAKR